MLNPINTGAVLAQARAGSAAGEDAGARNAAVVFRLLHGMYGTLFTQKFATGLADDKGRDRGVQSARTIWGHALARYAEPTLVEAIEQCKTDHKEFPPSLPQFLALCEARRPRVTHRPPQPSNALPMSQELRSEYSRRTREAAISRARALIDTKTGFVELPNSLDGLKRSVAHAAALGGADEAAELRRLDEWLAPKKEVHDAKAA